MTMSVRTLLKSKVAMGAAAIAATVGLSATVAYAQRSTINIDGSSTVFPITEAMAEEFRVGNPNVNISVGGSGTGGGFKKFCAGETVISDASRPIKDSERELCAANGIEYEVIPVAFDAITVVVNPESPVSSISVDELKMLWEPSAEGKITRWNQVNPSFPNEPIRLFGPGADSGTFDYFTDEVVGEEGASRGDYTASEDDNVLVLGVSRDENALGYFGMSYYLENQDSLKALGVSSEATGDQPVVPSAVTINDYKPLAREIFIYVDKAALASRPEVKSFVQFYLDNATDIVPTTGYVPLDASRYRDSRNSL